MLRRPGRDTPDCGDSDSERWAIFQGEYDGKPLIARINRSAKRYTRGKAYPYQVGCAVPFHQAAANGMPSESELADLAVLEDALRAELEANGKSFLVLVITTNGMREFVFYTSDAQFVEEQCKKVGDTVSSHDFQLIIQHDPNWSVYQRFVD
jgi:hypothetical protein